MSQESETLNGTADYQQKPEDSDTPPESEEIPTHKEEAPPHTEKTISFTSAITHEFLTNEKVNYEAASASENVQEESRNDDTPASVEPSLDQNHEVESPSQNSEEAVSSEPVVSEEEVSSDPVVHEEACILKSSVSFEPESPETSPSTTDSHITESLHDVEPTPVSETHKPVENGFVEQEPETTTVNGHQHEFEATEVRANENGNRNEVLNEVVASELEAENYKLPDVSEVKKSFLNAQPATTLSGQHLAAPKKGVLSTNLDFNGVTQSYLDVRQDTSDTQWAVFKFEGPTIVTSAKGSDFNDFKKQFGDEERAFGYIRVQTGDEISKRAKFLLVTWVGPSVSVLKRAKMSTDKALIKSVVSNFAVELQTENIADINLETFEAELDKAAGAHYGTGVRS